MTSEAEVVEKVVVGSSEEVEELVSVDSEDVEVEVGSSVEEVLVSLSVVEVGVSDVVVAEVSEVVADDEVSEEVVVSVSVLVGSELDEVLVTVVSVDVGSDDVGSVSVDVSVSEVEVGSEVSVDSVEVGESVTVSLAPGEASCRFTKLKPLAMAKSRSLRSGRAVRSLSARLWMSFSSTCSTISRTSTREIVPRSRLALSGAGAANVEVASRETQRIWTIRLMTAMVLDTLDGLRERSCKNEDGLMDDDGGR